MTDQGLECRAAVALITFEPAAAPGRSSTIEPPRRAAHTLLNRRSTPARSSASLRTGEGCDGYADKTVGVARVGGAGGSRCDRSPLYRQCRGKNRDGVVGAGVRPGRRYRLQANGRRLREG